MRHSCTNPKIKVRLSIRFTFTGENKLCMCVLLLSLCLTWFLLRTERFLQQVVRLDKNSCIVYSTGPQCISYRAAHVSNS